jgi:carboxyl-terminal processing protease
LDKAGVNHLFLIMLSKIIQFMVSKKSLPIVLVLVVAGFLIAFNSSGLVNPPGKYEQIFVQVTEMLEAAHYNPKKVDDEFSKKIFTKYIESLDPDKNVFLAADIKELKKFELSIDDELHGAPIQFFYAIDALYLKRGRELADLMPALFQQPFQFQADEEISLDPDKAEFPKNETARKEIWRKRLKFMTLERYSDLLDQRALLKSTDSAFKSDTQLENDARTKVNQIMSRNFERMLNKTKPDERFDMLVNVITNTMDPHTTFFPPLEKRSFDEQMSGKFYGIGASLRYDDGAIKVATIVAGLPAWKSQQITVGDQVLKVAQGSIEPVDLTGFETEEAVKLIRGKKGTEVRLTIKKADGSIRIVTMIREEVELDETYARSAVITEQGKKMGYIFLPEFYADWERPNGAKCSQDVAKEILKLKEQQVDGIIMDLRNNGGGSLYDVVQMVGFFIPDGPVVQVKDREGNPTVLRDRDRSVLYDGPLAVMVNEFSASASEIFAAAIQDYGRGVVIGSTSTYGKGTVQRNIGLESASRVLNNDNSELGTIKLTLQKFYRINGGSTQLKGVTPDIILPDQYENLKYREKDNPDAMPWDEIQRAFYTRITPTYDLETIKRRSSSRVSQDSSFSAVRSVSAMIEKSNQKIYSLKLDKYRNEQKQMRATFKHLEESNKGQQALSIQMLESDEKRLSTDNDKLERRKQWIKNLSRDIYISETSKVISDVISQITLVKGS